MTSRTKINNVRQIVIRSYLGAKIEELTISERQELAKVLSEYFNNELFRVNAIAEAIADEKYKPGMLGVVFKKDKHTPKSNRKIEP